MLNRSVNFAENTEIIIYLALNFIQQTKRYQQSQKHCAKSATFYEKASAVTSDNILSFKF